MKNISDSILIRYIEENLHEDNMKDVKTILSKNPRLKKNEIKIRKTLLALKEFGKLLEIKKIEPKVIEESSNIILFADYINMKNDNKTKIKKINII